MSVNPQTWARVRRVELRRLANEIGNEALVLVGKWPPSGEGRLVKQITEIITRRLDGHTTGTLRKYYEDLTWSSRHLDLLNTNSFFKSYIAERISSEKSSRGKSYQDQIKNIVKEISEFIDSHPVSKQTAVDILDEIVPEQKIGPVQFDFVNGVLKLKHSIPDSLERDRMNIDRAREALIEEGSVLLEELSRLNADRRVLDFIKRIQGKLVEKNDIIQLGMSNIAGIMVAESLEEEFSSIISAKMQSYSIGIGMYVAQFPEWVRFSENAAMADYNSDDIESIYQSGLKLIETLRVTGAAVDPEVPQTLSWMLEAIRDPRKAARRAVFAAMRTIENFVVKIFSECGNVISGVSSGAKSGVKIAVSGVVAVLLLTAAANVASSVSPSAAKILQTSWLKKAADIVLESMKNSD